MISQSAVRKKKRKEKREKHRIVEIIWEDLDWIIKKSVGRKKNQSADRTVVKISYVIQGGIGMLISKVSSAEENLS